MTIKSAALSLFKTNAALADYSRRHSALQSAQARRAAVKIAVIDDEAFQPQMNLKSFGYDITPLGDIKSISEVKLYDMILCDIVGVGRHFGSISQGASIISEIKNEYPEKIVVAYTGGSPSEDVQRIVRSQSDAIIKKDVDIQDWVAKLDELSAKAADPHLMWSRIRRRFIDLDVDSKQIILLEDAYVRSILENDNNFSKLRAAATSQYVQSDVRAIITGLISNGIFKLIVGN